MPQLADRLLEHQIGRAWSALVGADIARRAQPRSLINGTLEVAVDNSPWLHELTLRTDELGERVRRQFAAVRTLRFVLGAVDTIAPAPEPPRRRPNIALSGTEIGEIDQAASAIPDPTLAAAARRLLIRARRTPIPSGGVR